MKSRVMYMGTPEFAVPGLRRLAASNECDITLVVTQPDRPAGRGKKLTSPAVKVAAEELGLPVLQTNSLRDPDIRKRIIDEQPDLIVVAAFGMILGKWILELPTHGCVNLHASLLPKYRGANPIAAAIAMGERETGVTLMQMDRGLDTGPMYASASLEIAPDDTTESLTPRLADLAGDLLQANLRPLLAGVLEATPQGPGATLTRLMTKNDGWLDFERPAIELERHVRAMWPWPRAWTVLDDGSRMQVHRVRVVDGVDVSPCVVEHHDREVLVGCGQGSLEMLRVQLPGRKPIEGNALLQLPQLSPGSVMGQQGGPEDLEPLVRPVDAT